MCRVRKVLIIALVLLTVIVSAPGLARAETFFDLYGGAAFPVDSDTTIRGYWRADSSSVPRLVAARTCITWTAT